MFGKHWAQPGRLDTTAFELYMIPIFCVPVFRQPYYIGQVASLTLPPIFGTRDDEPSILLLRYKDPSPHPFGIGQKSKKFWFYKDRCL